jgi:hypothetical protein
MNNEAQFDKLYHQICREYQNNPHLNLIYAD